MEFEADQCPHCGFRYDQEALGQLAYELYTTTETTRASSSGDGRLALGFGFCKSCTKDLVTVVKREGDFLEITLLKPEDFRKAYSHAVETINVTLSKPHIDPELN